MSIKRIRALDRGLLVVEALSRSGSLSLTQLRDKTSLDNATLLRIIATLVDRGWVRQLLVEKKYELTHSLGDILGAQARAHPMTELAEPLLLQLKNNPFDLPSDLCAITGDGLFEIVESTRSKGPMAQARTGLGLRPSLFRSAHGRIILASLSPENRARHITAFLNRARKEDAAWYAAGHLDDEIAKAAANGYALREENYWEPPFDETPAVGALAVPIANKTGVYGSVSLLWLDGTIALDDILAAGMLESMKTAATRIAKKLSDNKVSAPA